MKRLLKILVLLACGSIADAQTVTLYTTITNLPTNGQTNFVATPLTNGLAFVWTNSVTASNQVLIGQTVAQSLTNEYRWLATNYYVGTWLSRGIFPGLPTNTFAISASGPLTNAASSGWATNWFTTNAAPFVNTFFGQVEYPDGSIQTTAASGSNAIPNVVTNNYAPGLSLLSTLNVHGIATFTNGIEAQAWLDLNNGNVSNVGTLYGGAADFQHNVEIDGSINNAGTANLNAARITNGVTGGLTADTLNVTGGGTLGGVYQATNAWFFNTGPTFSGGFTAHNQANMDWADIGSLYVNTNFYVANVTSSNAIVMPNGVKIETATGGNGGFFADSLTVPNVFLDLSQFPNEVDYQNNGWIFGGTNNSSGDLIAQGGAVTVVQMSKNGRLGNGGSMSVYTQNYASGANADALTASGTPVFSIGTNGVAVNGVFNLNGNTNNPTIASGANGVGLKATAGKASVLTPAPGQIEISAVTGGTTNRFLNDKLGEHLSIQDFTSLAGTNDISAVVEAAHLYLWTNFNGGTLYFPSTTNYTFSCDITNGGVTDYGDGAGYTLAGGPQGGTLVAPGRSGYVFRAGLDVTNVSGAKIKGFVFQGGSIGTNRCILLAGGSQNIQISDCWFGGGFVNSLWIGGGTNYHTEYDYIEHNVFAPDSFQPTSSETIMLQNPWGGTNYCQHIYFFGNVGVIYQNNGCMLRDDGVDSFFTHDYYNLLNNSYFDVLFSSLTNSNTNVFSHLAQMAFQNTTLDSEGATNEFMRVGNTNSFSGIPQSINGAFTPSGGLLFLQDPRGGTSYTASCTTTKFQQPILINPSINGGLFLNDFYSPGLGYGTSNSIIVYNGEVNISGVSGVAFNAGADQGAEFANGFHLSAGGIDYFFANTNGNLFIGSRVFATNGLTAVGGSFTGNGSGLTNVPASGIAAGSSIQATNNLAAYYSTNAFVTALNTRYTNGATRASLMLSLTFTTGLTANGQIACYIEDTGAGGAVGSTNTWLWTVPGGIAETVTNTFSIPDFGPSAVIVLTNSSQAGASAAIGTVRITTK